MASAQRLNALVLFDLDHTLLAGDSDVLWCEFLLQRGLLDASFAERNVAMDAAYRAGSVDARSYCDFYVCTLAGRTPEDCEPLRRDFLRLCIAPRIGAAARELVERQRRTGALLVLTTATNRVIAEPTAAYLGIEHLIATECGAGADGRYDGRTRGTLNMRAGKVERLHAFLAERGRRLADFDSTAYSDSINDLPLLQAVDHAVAVDADPQLAAAAAERGWAAISLREQP